MTWVGWTLGMQGEKVSAIQDKLTRKYAWARAMGVTVTGTYDQTTADAVAELQRRAGLPVTGIADWATQIRLGVVELRPPELTVAYTVPGTWASWNDGPPAWTAWKLDPKRYRQQGVGYPAMGFLTPDPQTSYVESRDAGVAELLRLALPDPAPKVLLGYSQGADVVVRFLERWPVERRAEIRHVMTFGSPCRPPGVTLLGGRTPPGAGIAGFYTPEWARGRTYDFTLAGDMYSEAVGLLPMLYDILTRLELSLDFAIHLFRLLTSTVGAQLLGTLTAGASTMPGFGVLRPLLGLITPGSVHQISGPISLPAIITALPAVVQTLVAALRFVTTNAHQHYHDQPAFDGLTAVDRAAQILNAA